MKLLATPLSHFSRKVRVLLDYYQCPYEFVDVGNVAEARSEMFANNPVMKVPVLIDRETWLVESDHIAQYLVQKFDKSDRLQTQTQSVFDLNARAVMNGVMSEEAKVILARRTAVPTEKYSFFDKALKSIDNGLAWLESNAEKFDGANPRYREIHLVCLWDHLNYYGFVPLVPYGKLRRTVAQAVVAMPILNASDPFVLKPR